MYERSPVPIRIRVAALCSIITMTLLTALYVYRGAGLPLVEALGTNASAAFVGALFGWCLASAVRRAPDRTARPGPLLSDLSRNPS